MRSNRLLFLAAAGLFLILSSSFSNPEENTATLTIEVTNIKNTKGVIEIGLYDNAEDFPDPDKQFKFKRIKPTSEKLKYKFTGLKPGKYAVALFHDENSDKVCNKNAIGIPTEAYAFSRNFRPKLKAPAFSDVYVSVKEKRYVTINLVY